MSIVLDKETRELAERAELKWGVFAQTNMMIEECGELIVVLAKRKRPLNASTVKEIVEELVDVELMLAQMKCIYGLNQDMWEKVRRLKIERLKKRLDAKT